MHRTFMFLSHALSAEVIYSYLLFNVCDLNAKEIFLLELKRRGGDCASITVNTLSFHLRADDAELRMELRLPALQQKVFRTLKNEHAFNPLIFIQK
jgi:hypothetical protein